MAPFVDVAVIVTSPRADVVLGKRERSPEPGPGPSPPADTWEVPTTRLQDGWGLLETAAMWANDLTGLQVVPQWVIDATYHHVPGEAESRITYFVHCIERDPQAVPRGRPGPHLPAWRWEPQSTLRRAPNLSVPLGKLVRRSSYVTEGRGLHVRLPADGAGERPVLCVRWERGVAGHRISGVRQTLTLTPGRDVSVALALADDRSVLDAVFMTEDDAGRNRRRVTLPLARSMVLKAFRVDDGRVAREMPLLAVGLDHRVLWRLWHRYPE